ncbi:MAG TPA: sulfotransferase, partial [Rubrobacteraceae bacterium]|nr:sulfotransferase [Rubrobacteraceae bacterium]
MTDGRIKVLYIAGFGRNGSTILGNILGELDGFFHGGELNFVWERNLLENRRCGCGAPFRECEVWNRVFDGAFGGMEGVDAREMARLQSTHALAFHTMLTSFPDRLRPAAHQRHKFLGRLEKLYEGVRRATGSRVIVDSSKRPLYGYLLGTVPEVDLHVVHLVRDPRASAYSWLRKKFQPDKSGQAYMLRFNPLESSLRWDVWNAVTEVLWRRSPERYLRLRYEDFVRKPQESIRAILKMLNEEASRLPFVDGTRVRLGTSHTVSGNPNRFQTGVVELRPDDEWASR